MGQDLRDRVARIRTSQTTRFVTYTKLNPSLRASLAVGRVVVPEYARRALTQIRLGSHHLAIERGRWSRTPRENRTCDCDGLSVQDEEHVLTSCPKSQQLKQDFNITNNIVNILNPEEQACRVHSLYCFKILELYQ